jgi:hypothetical protein
MDSLTCGQYVMAFGWGACAGLGGALGAFSLHIFIKFITSRKKT